jgi:hypothetical protein
VQEKNASKKLLDGIALLIVLSLCLCVTTFALVYSMVSLENNVFKTGYVKINLNDGLPIIEDRELLFAPGMSVTKTFNITNESTCNVYYRLYLENVTGSLASALEITILLDNDPLYSGSADDLTVENPTLSRELAINEQHTLTAIFHFPVGLDEEDNLLQGQNLEFDLRADAVQTKNNPHHSFD